MNIFEQQYGYAFDKDSSGCWNWKGKTNNSGYAYTYFRFLKRRGGAHRASYEAEHGPIPEGLLVLHKCDNRKCVNPEHLFVGTQKENLADCRRKGRLRRKIRFYENRSRGLKHSLIQSRNSTQKKIKDADLPTILASSAPAASLAEEYGVHVSTIYKIKKGTSRAISLWM